MFLAFYFSFSLFFVTIIISLLFCGMAYYVARAYLTNNFFGLPKSLWLFYLAFYSGIAVFYVGWNSNAYMSTGTFAIFLIVSFLFIETGVLRFFYFRKMDKYDFLLYRLITTGTPIMVFLGISMIYFLINTFVSGQ